MQVPGFRFLFVSQLEADTGTGYRQRETAVTEATMLRINVPWGGRASQVRTQAAGPEQTDPKGQ